LLITGRRGVVISIQTSTRTAAVQVAAVCGLLTHRGSMATYIHVFRNPSFIIVGSPWRITLQLIKRRRIS